VSADGDLEQASAAAGAMRFLKARLFALVVVGAIALALVGGLTTPTPNDGVPAYALEASIVYKIEIALAIFVALYIAVITLRLAWYGRTFTRVGASGAEIPDLSLVQAGVDHARNAERQIQSLQARLEKVTELQVKVKSLETRIVELEGRTGGILEATEGLE
jgi:hypothetical protein